MIVERPALAEPGFLAAMQASPLFGDLPTEPFDRLARFGATFLRAPVALIAILDGPRLKVLSRHTRGDWSGPREAALLEVLDREVRKTGQPLVTPDCLEAKESGIRGLLAVPLSTEEGTIGVLAVADSSPRAWSDQQVRVHEDLASAAVGEIQLRREAVRHRIEAEARQRVSVTDEVTGVYNRSGFFLFAEQHWKLARRNKRELLLIFVTVANLATVRREHGEAAAQQLMSDAALLLTETMRDTDIIARVGETELAVLALEAGRDEAKIITGRLEANLERARAESRFVHAPHLRAALPHVIRPEYRTRRSSTTAPRAVAVR